MKLTAKQAIQLLEEKLNLNVSGVNVIPCTDVSTIEDILTKEQILTSGFALNMLKQLTPERYEVDIMGIEDTFFEFVMLFGKLIAILKHTEDDEKMDITLEYLAKVSLDIKVEDIKEEN